MNKKWCIEGTADLDPEGSAAVDELFRRTAATLQANLLLLSGVQKPQVVCYADDFFAGRKEIDLLAAQVETPLLLPEQDAVSDEMLEALREMGKP